MGFHELIHPLLERDGIEVRVVANRLDPRPEGWRTISGQQEVCDVCGEPCKRSDVAGLDDFVYVGDGFSDRCVAGRLRGSSRATAWRSTSRRRSVPFEPFDDFYDVTEALDGAAVVPPGRSRGRKT